MENGGEWAMENGGEWKRRLPEMVMCSTCSGFVLRNKRKPNPDEEVVAEVEKMRDMLRAVLVHGPLQMVEPAEATRKQRQILQRRRRILVATKRCPACSGSPLEPCPTRFCSLLAKKREEVSEFMALLWSDGGKEISTEDEAMVANAKSSEHKLKRSREEGSSGSKEKKKAKGDDKEGSGSSKKKAKRSNEVEGSGLKEAEMEGSGYGVLIEGIVESVGGGMKTKVQVRRVLKKIIEILDKPPVKIEREEPMKEDIELPGGDRKTKMVTQRLDEKCVDLLKNRPRPKPTPHDKYLTNRRIIDAITAMDKVDRLFHGYLQYQSIIQGYAEYQLEVPGDEGDDWKLA